MPQHGFARDSLWTLKKALQLQTGETEITMQLTSNSETHKLFDYAFLLEVTFLVGKELSVTLTTTNTDPKPFTLTQALHTYLMVDDIKDISIEGVQETPFVDYTDEKKEKKEKEALQITCEVNRVYLPTTATCLLHDTRQKNTIKVSKTGSHSTTIWNPWQASGIHDLPDDTYRSFVCIETTNALSDAITLAPNTIHSISQTIGVT